MQAIVNKRLPREKIPVYLYEYNIDESIFQEKLKSFDYYLTNPNIEGVYETKVDLGFKSLALLGNHCKIKKGHQKFNKLEIGDLRRWENSTPKRLFQENLINSSMQFIFAWLMEVNKKMIALIITSNGIMIYKCQNFKEDKKSIPKIKNNLLEKLRLKFANRPDILQSLSFNM